MTYLSVCSGIEAATVAWHPLGWEAAAYAEIEKFPSAVLAHHYPDVPNLGDMTKFQEWPDAAVDVLVGGTPCQSFSVAGLREGLADPRGSLMLTFLAIARRHAPRWIVWENVPGVLSSNDGRDFGSFLGGLAECGYRWAYRVLDAQYFGLAQRRKRVFVVGHLGDWRRAAAVLFERESLLGHPPPRREAWENTTGPIAGCSNGGGANGPGRTADDADSLIPELANTLGGVSQSGGFRTTDLDNQGAFIPIAFSVKDYGQDAGDLSPTLRSGAEHHGNANGGVMPAIAFDARQSDVIQYGDQSGPLDTDGHTIGVAFAQNSRNELREMAVAGALAAEPGMKQQSYVRSAMQVRRLTPRECERLQGFPDDYTMIPYRGKPAADGPRYKALGNSMAVPVMRWIGERIAMVDAL